MSKSHKAFIRNFVWLLIRRGHNFDLVGWHISPTGLCVSVTFNWRCSVFFFRSETTRKHSLEHHRHNTNNFLRDARIRSVCSGVFTVVVNYLVIDDTKLWNWAVPLLKWTWDLWLSCHERCHGKNELTINVMPTCFRCLSTRHDMIPSIKNYFRMNLFLYSHYLLNRSEMATAARVSACAGTALYAFCLFTALNMWPHEGQ